MKKPEEPETALLIEIHHPDHEPVRMCTGSEKLIFKGNEYIPADSIMNVEVRGNHSIEISIAPPPFTITLADKPVAVSINQFHRRDGGVTEFFTGREFKMNLVGAFLVLRG